MRLRTLAVIPALVMTTMVTMAMPVTPALAAGSPVSKAKPHLLYRVNRGIGKTYLGAFSGDWRRCNYVSKATYTQNVSCSVGRTVTESVSGNSGFSLGVISSAVGFNVSYSTTVTSSTSVTVRPGGSGWYDVGFRYQRYMIGMEYRICLRNGTCNPWSKPDWVTVQRHLGNTFHYFGTGAV